MQAWLEPGVGFCGLFCCDELLLSDDDEEDVLSDDDDDDEELYNKQIKFLIFFI